VFLSSSVKLIIRLQVFNIAQYHIVCCSFMLPLHACGKAVSGAQTVLLAGLHDSTSGSRVYAFEFRCNLCGPLAHCHSAALCCMSQEREFWNLLLSMVLMASAVIAGAAC
jgi:hypothetical protein